MHVCIPAQMHVVYNFLCCMRNFYFVYRWGSSYQETFGEATVAEATQLRDSHEYSTHETL